MKPPLSPFGQVSDADMLSFARELGMPVKDGTRVAHIPIQSTLIPYRVFRELPTGLTGLIAHAVREDISLKQYASNIQPDRRLFSIGYGPETDTLVWFLDYV